MTSEMGFTNTTVSLRSPRVTVAIPNDEHWAFAARRALEFLNQTWGGARGAVLPLGAVGPHPAVLRLIQKYDPDHLVPLWSSITDLEDTRPGAIPFKVDGRIVPAEERRDFIRQVEEHGPDLQRLIPDERVEAARRQLNTFMEDREHARVHIAHPLQSPDRLIALPSDPTIDAVNIKTGDGLIDLSVGIHNGMSATPTGTRHLGSGDLTHFDLAGILVPGGRSLGKVDLAKPNLATVVDLNEISMGFRRNGGLLVVLGRTADDFALAMAWDHFAGRAAWLPVTRAHKTWLRYLGTALSGARSAGDSSLRVTSASLSEARCEELMQALWEKRMIITPGDGETRPWEYVDPMALSPTGRTDLRLTQRWDQRYALPTAAERDGARSMATRFPLVTAADGTTWRQWVVDAVADRAPIHSFMGFPADQLITTQQDRWETFVRASGTGISFESGRFDFVAAGASAYGQLAQPQLRWPGLPEMLNAAAALSNSHVRTSAPGHLGRLAAELFGGRASLSEHLHGTSRVVLDHFIQPAQRNGPLKGGGIGLHGSNFFAFADLASRVAEEIEKPQLRSWLDEQQCRGSIRTGNILNCGACQWVDFYLLADVGSTFSCKRCAAPNDLSLDRWREPIEGAKWYVDLHPTVSKFLKDHGDVPLLAVEALTRTGMRPEACEYEFEIVESSARKATAEIDFAFMSRGSLVLGEAKSNGTLDGDNKAARVRDAGKLITAGELLHASEVCYASSVAWKQASRDAILEAADQARSRITVSIVENVATPAAAKRTVLKNPVAV